MSSINSIAKSMNGIKTIETSEVIFTDDNSSLISSTGITNALNNKIKSVDFNTADGVLTLTKEDNTTLTKDLDGRYVESLSTCVLKTGTQTIDDVKTFTSFPVKSGTTLSELTPTADGQLTPKKYLDHKLGEIDTIIDEIRDNVYDDAEITSVNNVNTLILSRPDGAGSGDTSLTLPQTSLSTCVLKTSDQEIDDVKTFVEIPKIKIPTGGTLPTPTTNAQLSTKKYVDDTTATIPVGDAELDGANAFTNTNTFNDFRPTTDLTDTISSNMFITKNDAENRLENVILNGDLNVSSGVGANGKCILTLEADTDNSVEASVPQILFKQDGGYIFSGVGVNLLDTTNRNELSIANGVNNGSISFYTGTGDGSQGSGTKGYELTTERMKIAGNGDITFNKFPIKSGTTATELTPTTDGQLATKKYVDDTAGAVPVGDAVLSDGTEASPQNFSGVNTFDSVNLKGNVFTENGDGQFTTPYRRTLLSNTFTTNATGSKFVKIATLPASTSDTKDFTKVVLTGGVWTASPMIITAWFNNRNGFIYQYKKEGNTQTDIGILCFRVGGSLTAVEIWIFIAGGSSQYSVASWNIDSVDCDVIKYPTAISNVPSGTVMFDSINASYSPNLVTTTGEINQLRLTGTGINRILQSSRDTTNGNVFRQECPQNPYYENVPCEIGQNTTNSKIWTYGKIGIGTAFPTCVLDARGTTNLTDVAAYIYVESSGIKISRSSTSYMKWGNGGHHIDSYTTSNNFGRRMYLNYYAYQGVYLNRAYYSSDDRIKEEEKFIENATDTLLKLRPQTYIKYASIPDGSSIKPNFDLSGNFESGLIAQEIYYDAPELRHIVEIEDDKGDKIIPSSDDPQKDPDYSDWGDMPAGVDYIQLIPYLIKSNQELHERILKLEEKINM